MATYNGAQTPSATATTVHDLLKARLGRDVDQTWIDVMLLEAIAYVRMLAPCKKAAWIDYNSIDSADVRAVVLSALARIADNPRGYRQETIGEYSYTIGSGGTSGVGGIFNPSEIRVIAAESGCGGGFKSVHLTTSYPVTPADPEHEHGGVDVYDTDGVKALHWTFEEYNPHDNTGGKWVPR